MSFTYFIRCGDYVKIGKANDPAARLAQLQTGNPFDLKLIGVFEGADAEAVFQRMFADDHHKGEWFVISPKLVRFINDFTSDYDLAENDETELESASYSDSDNPPNITSLADAISFMKSTGARVEPRARGHYCLRYQIKDEDGNSVTYIGATGRKTYKRGYVYIPIEVVREMKEKGYIK